MFSIFGANPFPDIRGKLRIVLLSFGCNRKYFLRLGGKLYFLHFRGQTVFIFAVLRQSVKYISQIWGKPPVWLRNCFEFCCTQKCKDPETLGFNSSLRQIYDYPGNLVHPLPQTQKHRLCWHTGCWLMPAVEIYGRCSFRA